MDVFVTIIQSINEKVKDLIGCGFMKYLEYLEEYREIKQKEIEELMKYYKAEPVGSGYIDIITPFHQ